MQTSGLYASPSPHPLYHSAYHPVLPGPQDHELKKRYLALLPPQQIIDICLNFDLHVPHYVKSTVWPADINAAIAAIQKSSAPSAEMPVASTSTSNDASSATSTVAESSTTAGTSIQQPSEAQPPDKALPSHPEASTSKPSPAPPEPATAPPAPQVPTPTPQQPPYPHQPYGYGHHPQAAYPHAPYYQAPPGYPPYPTPYPYQMPGYPQPHPAYPQPTTNPYAPTPIAHPPPPQPQDVFSTNPSSTDDLPNYEEMIVEALTDSADPEGCAPKDLFTWMASRYPLHPNFRPSASQALQKAFKRGRFQKSSGGKYRLNTSWEGGTTSRRTTRRPQTQNPPSASPAPASPFTHAPLVHHNQPNQTAAFQNQPFGYPSQQQVQGFSSFTQTGQAETTPASMTTSTAADTSQSGSAQDAWEAAQNILKAINFDSLLSLPKEDERSKPDQPIVGPSSTESPSMSTSIATVGSGIPSAGPVDAPTVSIEPTGTEDYAAGRAELQAHLALLAAQLAELSQEDEDDHVVHYPVVQPTPVSVTTAPPVVAIDPSLDPFAGAPAMASLAPPHGVPSHPTVTDVTQQPVLTTATSDSLHPPLIPLEMAPEEEEEDSDDGDMEEVI